jgi:hypothetical protein
MKRSIIAIAFAAFITFAGMACQPPYNFVVIGADGQTIRQSSINAIVQDSTLTDDQKRQALRDLGITDENLIDFLVLHGTAT